MMDAEDRCADPLPVRIFVRICEAAVVVAVAAIAIIVLLSVYYRYVLGNSLSWSDEAARYLMIWLGFVAAGLVLRDDEHIGITLFRDALPPALRLVAVLASDLLILFYLVILVWTSWTAGQIIGNDISPGLGIRTFWSFLALPVGAALMAVNLLSVMPRHVRTMRYVPEPAAEPAPAISKEQ